MMYCSSRCKKSKQYKQHYAAGRMIAVDARRFTTDASASAAVFVFLFSVVVSLLLSTSEVEMVKAMETDKETSVTTTATSSSSIENKIVGGTPAAFGEYRAFAVFDSVGCGGILIHGDIVLSAAHCFVDDPTSVVGTRVFLGSTQRDGSDAIETMSIRSVRTHPDYEAPVSVFINSENLTDFVALPYYDFAILKLSRWSSTITPLPYNNNSAVPRDGIELITMGYGSTTQDGDASLDLLKVSVKAVNITKCATAYNNGIDPIASMCAAAPNKDSCSGDSGGPLLLRTSNTSTSTRNNSSDFVVVGIVSAGIGCAQSKFPGIYSRVSAAANDFIRTGICELSNNPPSDCGPRNNNTTTVVCLECRKSFLGLPLIAGIRLFKEGDDSSCRERCSSNWLVWFWKLLGWKCGAECPL